MNDDLRFLKESLDDTYLKDMELSKSLKKKIFKKATASSRTSRIMPKLAYLTTMVMAAGCLVVLGLSQLQPATHQGSQTETHQAHSQPTIREQQVALIHLQNEMVALTKDQRQSEELFVIAIENNQSKEKLEALRSKVIHDGETIINGIEKISIPTELAANQTQLTDCLQLLITAYKQKNEYYKKLDLQEPPDPSPYNVPVMKFIVFEETMGEVFKSVNLLPPNFQLLLTFLR